MNKRGQELSVTAIILIVLGVLILVFLILGFTVGWKNIMPWIKPLNNAKEIADACKLACFGEDKFGYCSQKRDLRSEEETIKDATCIFLANIKIKYGIEKCPAVTCDYTVRASLEEAQEWCDSELKKIDNMPSSSEVKNQEKLEICEKWGVGYLDDTKTLQEKTCDDIMKETTGYTKTSSCL